MKNNVLKISFILLIVVVLVAFNYVNATSSQKMFGGVIVETKAKEIQEKEDSNYKCIVPGKTITIKPKSGDETSYFIPATVKQRGGKTLRNNQNILGYYSQSKTTITCIFQGTPPKTATVTLTPITLFGTNK